MALALENPGRIVLLDDLLARRAAGAAGLNVWGTLRIFLEAKRNRLTHSIAPHIDRLSESGLWISDDIRKRILNLAGE
jgi:predicted nucleic acid-binding protein